MTDLMGVAQGRRPKMRKSNIEATRTDSVAAVSIGSVWQGEAASVSRL